MTIGTIILYPTNAGNDVQNRALAGEIPMPKISRVTASNGIPHADPYNATTLTGDISIAATKHAEQVAVERLSDSAMRITAGFGPETHLSITQIGVWLDDGTLFAYGPLPTAFEKGDGVGVALPMVLSRSALDQIQLDINILDVNALGAQLVAMVMARVLGLSNSVVMELLAPLSQAVKYSWLAGSQKFQIEMFGFGFTLLDIEPLDITGARARDDSLDLAEAASTLLSGDYLVFDAANAEQVRLLPAGNLDQGRRRLQWDLLHTYPATAQLARTNWTITPGNATCPAGGVYFSGRVRLTDGDVHRVFVYGLTAPGAPTVDWRTDAGEFVPAVLLESRVHEGEWSEYAFEVPAGQYFHLRVTTPTATRIRAIVACNTLRGVRVVTPPTIVGNAARPSEPVALALSAESRLVGGSVVQFDLVSAGLLTQHPATANAAVATLTLAGEAGEYRDIIATAVDDLGNRSLSIAHRIELRDDAAPAAPVILTPAANATGVSLTPTLTITAPLIAGESHASTDWQIRASNGVDVVWQALASAQLTSMTVDEALPANTELQVWVRGRGSLGTETAWGSRGFVTQSNASTAGQEAIFTTSTFWTIPAGVHSISAVAIGAGGSGGHVSAGGGGALAYMNNIGVTPGERLSVIVGDVFAENVELLSGGYSGLYYGSQNDFIFMARGGSSNQAIISNEGGSVYTSASYTPAIGYPGGTGISGGGGAGGYLSAGGNGRSDSIGDNSSFFSYDGGNGGAYDFGINGMLGGGGVGLYGSIPGPANAGRGGSGGENANERMGGDYGGGGPKTAQPGQFSHGGRGAVRIIWGTDSAGTPRTFPNNAA